MTAKRKSVNADKEFSNFRSIKNSSDRIYFVSGFLPLGLLSK